MSHQKMFKLDQGLAILYFLTTSRSLITKKRSFPEPWALSKGCRERILGPQLPWLLFLRDPDSVQIAVASRLQNLEKGPEPRKKESLGWKMS